MTIQVPERFKPLVESFHKRKEYVRRGRARPFILFGYDSTETKDGVPQKVPALHMLDCSGTTGQKGIIEQYALGKGFQILEVSLPEDGHDEVKRGALGQILYHDKEGGSYAELRQTVRHILSGQDLEEANERMKVMQDKLDALEAKEKKKGA